MRTTLLVAALLAALAGSASADAVRNSVALFAGLDKITGKITRFEADIDEVTRFGSLDVRARVCNTRPATEQPKTTAFVEVEETLLDGGKKRVFTGWMLAESPGLNAVEHPVYDVWLTGCRDPEASALGPPDPSHLDPGLPDAGLPDSGEKDSFEKLLDSLDLDTPRDGD